MDDYASKLRLKQLVAKKVRIQTEEDSPAKQTFLLQSGSPSKSRVSGSNDRLMSHAKRRAKVAKQELMNKVVVIPSLNSFGLKTYRFLCEEAQREQLIRVNVPETLIFSQDGSIRYLFTNLQGYLEVELVSEQMNDEQASGSKLKK